MNKKIIIIGSGLGGLSSGMFLAKCGFDVTILEQSEQIGGCLQCFKRKGVKFETGMHFIGSADEGQILDKLLVALEIKDKIKLSRLNTDGYDIISINGKQYKIANGRENYINELCRSFPSQRKNLQRYWDIIDKVSSSSSLHSLNLNDQGNTYYMEYQMKAMDEVIESIITDPLLAKIVAGNLPLYAAERGKTPFSIHAFIADFYNNSAFRVVGGSDSIARALADTIIKYNGRIIKKKKVVKIICDNKKVTGVECDDGMLYDADIVISGVHPIRTLEMIDNIHLLRPAYRNRIKAMNQTIGGFAVYLHFKKNAVPYMNYNYYAYGQDTPWNCEAYTDATWPKGYLYMHFCHEDTPHFAQAGVILSYMRMEEVEKWKGSTVGKRGEEYEDFKTKRAEKLLDCLEIDYPGIRTCIETYYTSTPLTYLDYTGTEDGSMYGISKNIHSGIGDRVSHKTHIPNLLLTGQNINSHGMLGTIVGSIVTCSEILSKDKLIGLISKK